MKLTYIIENFPDDVSFVGLAKVSGLNYSDNEYFTANSYYPVFIEEYDDSLCMIDDDLSYSNAWSICCDDGASIEDVINGEISSANFEFIDKSAIDLFIMEYIDEDEETFELTLELKVNEYEVELI